MIIVKVGKCLSRSKIYLSAIGNAIQLIWLLIYLLIVGFTRTKNPLVWHICINIAEEKFLEEWQNFSSTAATSEPSTSQSTGRFEKLIFSSPTIRFSCLSSRLFSSYQIWVFITLTNWTIDVVHSCMSRKANVRKLTDSFVDKSELFLEG